MSRKETKKRNSATAGPGQAIAEFDREFIVDTFRPLTAEERNRWARARVKRPRDSQGKAVSAIIISDSVRIPKSITDLESFRRWACSESFPEQGRISYLAGEIWVDLSMEQLFSHNALKAEMNAVLSALVKLLGLGYFFINGARLSNPDANLSVEPDGLFVSYASIRTARVRLIEGAKSGFIELEGSPDMALEIVSDESIHKDTEILRDLYWRAGVTEYWLMDARREPLRFDILRRTARGYVATRRQGGWLKSAVFGKAFALEQGMDRSSPASTSIATCATRRARRSSFSSTARWPCWARREKEKRLPARRRRTRANCRW